LHFPETLFHFPQSSAHRLNDPWIVCRAFLLGFGEQVNRLRYEDLRATQWV